MIIEFKIVVVESCDDMLVVTAIMFDEPPIELGWFEDMDEVELACHRFQVEHAMSLH
jgi:hypothetical protein